MMSTKRNFVVNLSSFFVPYILGGMVYLYSVHPIFQGIYWVSFIVMTFLQLVGIGIILLMITEEGKKEGAFQFVKAATINGNYEEMYNRRLKIMSGFSFLRTYSFLTIIALVGFMFWHSFIVSGLVFFFLSMVGFFISKPMTKRLLEASEEIRKFAEENSIDITNMESEDFYKEFFSKKLRNRLMEMRMTQKGYHN